MDSGTVRRSTGQRQRSDSDERLSVRSYHRRADNHPQSRVTSPGGHETARITSRDYAQTLSPSPTRSRARYIGFGVPTAASIRRRLGSAQPSPNPSAIMSASWRGMFDTTKRSIAVGVPSVQFTDAPSRKFSLAGPAPVETLVANSTYVDPGYAQLNPEYDQPANARPVWGLAKPLPRVIRSGMVPARDEIKKELQQEEQEPEQDSASVDLEHGRIEPTLRPDKLSNQLDTLRRDREMSLYRAWQQLEGSQAPSPFGTARKPLDAPTEIPDTHSRYDAHSRYGRDDTHSRYGHEEAIEEEPRSEQYYREHSIPDIGELPQLSEAIQNVKQAREEEETKAAYQDAIPLPAYDAEEDEIHNLHTYWSVIRLYFRDSLSEILCVMMQDVIGFSVNLALCVSQGTVGVGDTADYAWGFAAMVAIYVGGGVSGAHLNPAMSIMLTVYRGFPTSKLPKYIIAQFIGVFLSTLITYALFKPGLVYLQQLQQKDYLVFQGQAYIQHNVASLDFPSAEITLRNFLVFPRQPWVTHGLAFCTELLATILLTIAVLAMGDDANAPPGAGMNAFVIGLLVTVLSMGFSYQTGLAMNPVRDLGPRVALWLLGYGRTDGSPSLWADGYWFKVNILAPISGTLTGAFIYDTMIFTGGESPVNYPTKRIMRVVRKWRKMWRARIEETKEKVKAVGGEPGYEPVDG